MEGFSGSANFGTSGSANFGLPNMTDGADCVERLQNKSVYEIFSLVVPSNGSNWEPRTHVWYGLFFVMIVLFVLLFLALGVASVLLLVKRHLAQRFKARTWLAIDIALATLGFSRVIFLLLDPWGQWPTPLFCKHVACVIVSRFIGALAFPSLTASYTLVFITLWMSAKIHLGRSWVQRLKFLIPLCFAHYVVAIVFEVVGAVPVSTPVVVIALLISCEAFFSVGGFLICFAFLFAGWRLLRSVKKSAIKSSSVCRDSPSMSRHDLIEKSKFQNRGKDGRQRSRTTMKLKQMLREKHVRAIRKITRITYVTATLGILYSLVTLVNLVLVCLSLFRDCMPGSTQYPAVWLTIRYVVFALELGLAVLLTYSINDYKPVVQFMMGCMGTCCGLRKVASRKSSPDVMDSSTVEVRPSPLILPKTKIAAQFSVSSDESRSECSLQGTPLPQRQDKINGNVPVSPSPLVVSFSATEDKTFF